MNRTIPLAILLAGLCLACGDTTYPGSCREGQLVDCTCADGAAGQKPCGAATCTCAEPECREGETLPCTCEDGSPGERVCGEPVCVCEAGRCELVVQPAAIDFGAVPSGLEVVREVVLENEGYEPCTVMQVALEGCGESFTVEAPLGTPLLSHGARLAIPVHFRADGAGERSCQLTVHSASSTAVALRGVADPGCLSVEPSAIEFGPVTENCGNEVASVTVVNGCDVPVDLESVAVDGAAFVTVSTPPLPWSIAPRSSSSTDVAFRPEEDGGHAGQLRLGLRGLGSRTVALAGTAEETPWLTDTFEVGNRVAVDVLFVIDNGTNMAERQENLQENLFPMLSYLLARDLDFHVGVTTTGLEPNGDCPGGVGGGEDGRLFPVIGETARILTNETPDLESQWQTNVSVGACRTGPNRIFEAAVRALTPPVADAADDPRHPEENDGNAGFLRPEAFLSVIAITDRDDDSPELPNHYLNELLALKGFRNQNLFQFHAVAGDPGTGCGTEDPAAPAERLEELVNQTSGGAFASICDPDWGEMFRWGSTTVRMMPDCLYLSETPVDLNGDGTITDTDGELELRLNGSVLPSRGAQGQRVWSYSLSQNGICFNPLAEPEPGSTVEVRYPVACLAD